MSFQSKIPRYQNSGPNTRKERNGDRGDMKQVSNSKLQLLDVKILLMIALTVATTTTLLTNNKQ